MIYEEEDEESNEIDNITKVIEKKLKLEVTINKQLEESEDFIKNNEWKVIEDHTYHFKQNIDRIWERIKSLDSIFMDNNIEYQPFILKKGSNTWNLGNIFEGKIFNIYEFNAKVIKQKIFSELKKIEWLFILGDKENFRLKVNLYKVTEDNSTVIHLKIKYSPINGDSIILKLKEKFNANNYFKDVEKLLKKESVYLYQYESGIIPANMDNIWEIVTDCSKLVLVAPNNKCFVPININNVKVGEISNVPMNIKKVEGYLEIKLDLKEKKEGWNRWAFGYSILGGEPFRIAKQTVLIQLTKINKYETQLSIFTKIYESLPLEMFKCLSRKKKYVISSIKKYFENFDEIKGDINK